MSATLIGTTCVIAQPFAKALLTVRQALRESGLSIAGEFDVAADLNCIDGPQWDACRILYVDTPVFLFEALALDRAAAVFLPLHLLVAAKKSHTRVSWSNPCAMFDARLPAGASSPIDELRRQIARALAPYADQPQQSCGAGRLANSPAHSGASR